jgi:hypothetical protein
MQAQSLMDINAAFGREVFPPSMIIPHLNITGKAEAIQFLQQQEQSAQAQQQELTNIQHTYEEAKLKELYSKAVANIATARERHGRAEADIGLFEERLSEITQNRAMSLKAKTEAIKNLVEVEGMIGQQQMDKEMFRLQSMDAGQEMNEDREKVDAKQTAMSNDFMMQVMGQMQQNQEERAPIQGQQAEGQ